MTPFYQFLLSYIIISFVIQGLVYFFYVDFLSYMVTSFTDGLKKQLTDLFVKNKVDNIDGAVSKIIFFSKIIFYGYLLIRPPFAIVGNAKLLYALTQD